MAERAAIMTCRVDGKDSRGGGALVFDTGDTVWVCGALGN